MNILNWQNYRSEINGMSAVFLVNVGEMDKFHNKGLNSIVEFSVPYQGDAVDGLPDEVEYNQLMDRVFALQAELTAMPEVFCAGFFICNHHARLYFYCKEPKPIQALLAQIPHVADVTVQEDPQWDIYFDYLMASPLDIKLNATEEVLNLLIDKGRSLSQVYQIEHSFHFEEEAQMFKFMEEFNTADVPFEALKYSNQPIKIDEEEIPFMLVKVEQELSLETNDIFEYVTLFEKMAKDYAGEYIGWECDDLFAEDEKLN